MTHMMEKPASMIRPWPKASRLLRATDGHVVGRQWGSLRAADIPGLLGDLFSVTPPHLDILTVKVVCRWEKRCLLVDIAVVSAREGEAPFAALPGATVLENYVTVFAEVKRNHGQISNPPPLFLHCHRDGDFWEDTGLVLVVKENDPR